MMSVNSAPFIANIFRISLCDMLCTISTFQSNCQNLTIERKSMVLIIIIRTDINRINLNIYKYKSDLDSELPITLDSVLNSPSNIPLLSTHNCVVFIDVVTKTKTISKVVTKEQKKAIL